MTLSSKVAYQPQKAFCAPTQGTPSLESPHGVAADPFEQGKVTLTRATPAEHWGIDRGLGPLCQRGGRVAVVLRLLALVAEQMGGLEEAMAG